MTRPKVNLDFLDSDQLTFAAVVLIQMKDKIIVKEKTSQQPSHLNLPVEADFHSHITYEGDDENKVHKPVGSREFVIKRNSSGFIKRIMKSSVSFHATERWQEVEISTMAPAAIEFINRLARGKKFVISPDIMTDSEGNPIDFSNFYESVGFGDLHKRSLPIGRASLDGQDYFIVALSKRRGVKVPVSAIDDALVIDSQASGILSYMKDIGIMKDIPQQTIMKTMHEKGIIGDGQQNEKETN